MSIIILGSTSIEFVCEVSRFPQVGETILCQTFQKNYGAAIHEALYLFSSFSQKVCLITAIGDDDNGKELLSFLKSKEDHFIDLEKHLIIPQKIQTSAELVYFDNNYIRENTVFLGASEILDKKHVSEQLHMILTSSTASQGTLTKGKSFPFSLFLCNLLEDLEALESALTISKASNLLNFIVAKGVLLHSMISSDDKQQQVHTSLSRIIMQTDFMFLSAIDEFYDDDIFSFTRNNENVIIFKLVSALSSSTQNMMNLVHHKKEYKLLVDIGSSKRLSFNLGPSKGNPFFQRYGWDDILASTLAFFLLKKMLETDDNISDNKQNTTTHFRNKRLDETEINHISQEAINYFLNKRI